MRKLAILLALSIIAITACSRNKFSGFDLSGVRDAVAKNETVDLSKTTSFAWDTVYFFGPYSTPEEIKREVGTEVPFPRALTEGDCLVVFVLNGKVMASGEVNRGKTDFSELPRHGGYKLNEAKFKMSTDSSGRKILKPV